MSGCEGLVDLASPATNDVPKTLLNFFREDILSGGNECAPKLLTPLSSCFTFFFS